MPFIDPENASQSVSESTAAAQFYYFQDPSALATDTTAMHLDDLEKLLADAEQRSR